MKINEQSTCPNELHTRLENEGVTKGGQLRVHYRERVRERADGEQASRFRCVFLMDGNKGKKLLRC